MFSDYTISFHVAASKPPAPLEVLTATEQKTDTLFSAFEDLLLAVNYWFQCSFMRLQYRCSNNVYQGKVLSRTYNAGKAGDAYEYARLKRHPLKIAEELQTQLKTGGYKVPEAGIQLSPIPVSQGVCLGACTLVAERLLVDEEKIETIAEDFETGVPLDGVLNQETYRNVSTTFKNSGINSTDAANKSMHLLFQSKGLTLSSKMNEQEGTYYITRKKLLSQINTINESGCYLMTMGVYGRLGNRGGFHATEFIVQKDGSTVFYDPNYSFTIGEGLSRKEAIESLFDHYNLSTHEYSAYNSQVFWDQIVDFCWQKAVSAWLYIDPNFNFYHYFPFKLPVRDLENQDFQLFQVKKKGG